MPAVPRALALASTLSLAALALAPISGASAAAGAAVRASDGLVAKPAATRTAGAPRARAAQVGSEDPRIGDQWALQGDAPMGAESAWRQTVGADVTVAVIDSGVDLGHPDLAPNLWTNPGELPGNGIDDDGNGYVDDVHGYDFVGGDGDPQDENGHGTHVAGIIGARGGNGIGGAGVAWRVNLMAVRVLDADARGTTTSVADGIRYAVTNGARIINLSLAGPSPTPELEDAVRFAQDHGVLVVVAAGNEGTDLAAAPTYPAAYTEANVLGVAATAQDGRLSSVSDYGPGADLAAPGEQILSTAIGGGYEWRTGTSMAAPEVAGALVLLAAARPDLDAGGLRDALLGTARHTGLPVQAGALDVGAALHAAIAPGAWRDAPATTSTTTASTQAKRSTPTKSAAKRTVSKAAAAKARKAKAHKAAARRRARIARLKAKRARAARARVRAARAPAQRA